MRNNDRKWQIITFSVLFLLSLLVTFLSYTHHTEPDTVLGFLSQYHAYIMAFLVLAAALYGAYISTVLATSLARSEHSTKQLASVALKVLSADERRVLKHLVKHEGTGTQADISRLPKMTRVKAHRIVKRLEEHRVVRVEERGKMRKIILDEDLYGVLADGLERKD